MNGKRLRVTPTLKQNEAYKSLKTHDIVLFGGGVGGGKTWAICESRLINCLLYPGYKSFFGRKELKRIMGTTLSTWFKVCEHHGVRQDHHFKFNGQYNYIKFNNGSRIDLIDLAHQPGDPYYERLGSYEFTDGAIDECGEIEQDAFEILRTRVGRHKNDEFGLRPSILLTCNPKRNWIYSRFYLPHKNGALPKNVKFIESLYSDNPHLSAHYEKQLEEMQDETNRKRLYMGDWEYDTNPNALLDTDAIHDLWENDEDARQRVPEGVSYITADIAMQGSDLFVIGVWKGYVLVNITTMKKSDGKQIADLIQSKADQYDVFPRNIVYDSDGVGDFLGGYIKGAIGFKNNSSPRGSGNYHRLKDQCGYRLAKRINEAKLRILPETYKEQMIEELEQLRSYRTDDDAKLRIMPKKDIKKNIGRSPDFLDMMIMREYFGQRTGKIRTAFVEV